MVTHVYICKYWKGDKMGQKNVTLSIDEKIYEDYKGFCRKKKLLYLEVLETL